MGKICLFTGDATSFNVVLSTRGIYSALLDNFDIDIVTTSREVFKNIPSCDLYGKGPNTMANATRLLYSYLSNNSPSVVVNITKPPFHGNICGIITSISDTKFVYRYSGDRFVSHCFSEGWDKITSYTLNNIAGRLPLYVADKCIALGPKGRERLCKRGVSRDSVAILPPIINPDRFETTEKAEISGVGEEDSVVLFVGRLNWRKGYDILLEAIPRIADERPDVCFVFVGRIDEEYDVPKEYEHQIIRVGEVPPSRMAAYYNRSDLLVHPSRTESFARVLAEAQYCGIPVIANEAGDMPYVTKNTFSTVEELAEMVSNFESIPIENKSRFTPESQRDAYVRFFDQFG